MKNFTLSLCSLILTAALQAQIIHVPADYPTIQQGINAANPGDTVLVADGTYDEQINFKGKKPLMVSSQFLMDGNVSHIDNTIIEKSTFTSLDSASLVYFVSGEDTTSVLCGFTIRHGKGTLCTYQGKTIREGGGIFISSSGAKILNNHITGNNLSNVLQGNSNFVRGAGIGCELKTDPHWVVVSDNMIDFNSCSSNNLGASGAGISICYNSRITGNTISDNTCTGTGTAYAVGAGFDCEKDTTSFNAINVVIHHNVIKSNHLTTESSYATAAGGVISGANSIFSDNEVINNDVFTGSTSGGNIIGFYNPRAGCIARNNIFRGNTTNRFGTLGAETDAGLAMNMVLFENNYFIDNNAIFGGAISIITTPAIIQNNVFSGNNATQKGGAVYCRPGITSSTEHMVTFINNSFFGNKSILGGAIYANDYTVKPLIINSIFWGDTASSGSEIYLEFSYDTIEIANSNIDPALIEGGRFRDGGGNINTDPFYTNLDSLFTQVTSPVIDAGTAAYTCACGDAHICPQYDLLGLPRPWGTSLVDIGAYEYTDFGGVHKEIAKNLAIFPNPFTNSVTISYTTDKAGPVLLQVFDNFGRLTAELVNALQPQGEQKIEWNAGKLPVGIYYCRLQLGNHIISNKIIKM
jgi:predicted outer membrane repeat protein